MSTSVEASARTVEEAIQKGIEQLGVRPDQVVFDLLQEPSAGGLLGLGKKDALVRVSIKPSVEQAIETNLESSHTHSTHLMNEGRDEVDSPETVSYVVSPNQADEYEDDPYYGDDQDEGITKAETKEEKAVKDYLSKVLAFFEDDLTIKTHWEDDRLHVDIDGEDCAVIIGHKGETMNALQYLTSSAVNRISDERVRVVLDVCGYRGRRKYTLEKMAKRYAAEVIKRQAEFVMEPMCAADRRIIHYALQNEPGVYTASEGIEPHRSVVIVPKP